MIYLIIYLIGFIWAYYLGRKIKRKNCPNTYNWGDVFIIVFCSLLSYLMVFLIFDQAYPNFKINLLT